MGYKKSKRSIREQFLAHSKNNQKREDHITFSSFLIEHGYGKLPTKADTPPKKKKGRFHFTEYNWSNKEPKWHRKLFHVLPFRRSNRIYEYHVKTLSTESFVRGFDDEGNAWEALEYNHPADGLPEPLWNKPHIYYW